MVNITIPGHVLTSASFLLYAVVE